MTAWVTMCHQIVNTVHVLCYAKYVSREGRIEKQTIGETKIKNARERKIER